MNTFDYSDLLPPLSLGVANLVFVGILYRAIVRSPALLRRRHFFESLAVLAFVAALVLSVIGFVLWRDNPHFVLVCSASWMLLCVAFASILRYRDRRRARDELEVPELWPPISPARSAGAYAESHGRREPTATAPRPTDESREHAAVPLDAFTRARLKRARRERSAQEDRTVRNGRFRMNRPAVVPDEPETPSHRNRDER